MPAQTSRSIMRATGLLLPLAFVILFAQCNSKKSDDGPKDKSDGGSTSIRGGKFEASGVVFVPGTNGVLFIDDGSADKVMWMQLDGAGLQSGDVKTVAMGGAVENPEGITFDGTHFYVVSSQTSKKSGADGGLIRFSFDPRTQSATGAEVITGLRDFLIQNVAELRGEGEKKGADGGLNIEGIAWDPAQQALLLGLRSPQVGGNALIVPLKLRDPLGPFTLANIQAVQPNAIQLGLGGAGIRDIQYDGAKKTFWIISGAPENQDKSEFTLWEWGGNWANPAAGLAKKADLSPKMKPEGITRVELPGGAAAQSFVFVIGDASSYMRVD